MANPIRKKALKSSEYLSPRVTPATSYRNKKPRGDNLPPCGLRFLLHLFTTVSTMDYGSLIVNELNLGGRFLLSRGKNGSFHLYGSPDNFPGIEQYRGGDEQLFEFGNSLRPRRCGEQDKNSLRYDEHDGIRLEQGRAGSAAVRKPIIQ